MKKLFICYPKCSTCLKAKKFLDEHKIEYQMRDITKDIPTKEELKKWSKDIPLNKFFNTSGIMYRQLHLKDKIFLMNDLEKLEMLSGNGMLIKRPILVVNDKVLLGFKEEEWSNLLNK